MRRVNIRNGLKQRMNEILGTDSSIMEGRAPGITDWSVQAAMLNNFKRLGKAIVGDSLYGRTIKGLALSYANGNYSISAGIGITPNGDIIVLNNQVRRPLSGTGTNYFYIKHILAELDGSKTGGKKTEFISKAGEENIVYDDLASTIDTDLGTELNNIIIIKSLAENENDLVYIGSIIDGIVTPTIHRGFPTNKDFSVDSITCAGLVVIEGAIKLANAIYVFNETEWTPGIDQEIIIPNGTLTFKNGILIKYESI